MTNIGLYHLSRDVAVVGLHLGAVSDPMVVFFFFLKYSVGYPQKERVAHVVFDVRRSG